jgi:acyl-CoA synthetase (NDP forming)
MSMTDSTTGTGYDELLERFEPLFTPASIAIAGASARGAAQGNTFLRQLQTAGFAGQIVFIHPSASSIEGYPAYPSFAEVPLEIDYAYIAVPSRGVAQLIASGAGRVKFAQVISSGFGEGDGLGAELAGELTRVAHDSGVRVIGPNCLGTHSPRGGVSFVGGADSPDGTVSVVSQSGGLSVDMIRRGRSLGLKFRSVVSVGNALDVDPIELVEYYLADPDTRAVGLYIEQLSDGRRFVELLRRAESAKPIVVLKGGTTAQGSRAAASHTGAAATDERLWEGLARQFGLTFVDTMEQFLHSLLAFEYLSGTGQAARQDVVLFGNGGGVNVLAADQFARADLAVLPLSAEVVDAAESLSLPPGASVVNPVDLPAGVFAKEEGRLCSALLRLILERERPGSLVVHLNIAAMLQGAVYQTGFRGFLADALPLLRRHGNATIPVLVLNSDGSVEADDARRELAEAARSADVAAVNDFAAAIHMLTAINRYDSRRGKLRRQTPGS